MKYSIPAYLSNFSTLEDGRTKGRLKVLYVGETADGRIFDKDFSDQLKDSLADAPVVAYYSDLKQDFLGHNSVQYVFGHVPSSDSNIEYVKEDGQDWLYTDVLLYTDRSDSIGEIAKKIVGHPHSLELDPKTVEYEIKREGGKTKIHFLKGRICGLSVLGTDQKPAFTGSAFLNCSMNDELQNLKERFENFFNCLEEESRGGQMDEKLRVFESLANAARLSYDDQKTAVSKKFGAEMGDDYGYYVEEIYSNEVIFHTLNWNTGTQAFYKCGYVIDDNGEVNLSDLEEVFHVFVTGAQKTLLESQLTTSENEEDDKKKEPVPEDKEKEPEDCTTDPEKEPEEPEKESEPEPEDKEKDDCSVILSENEGALNDAQDNSNANVQTDVAALYESAKVQIEELTTKSADFATKNAELETELSSVRSQLEAANVELDAFKTLQKQTLIDSFKDSLDEQTIADYNSRIGEFNYAQLESALALSFTKTHKGQDKSVTVTPTEFTFNNDNITTELSYAELVNKYKNRKK